MTFSPPPPPPPPQPQHVLPMTDSELDAFDPNDSAQITRERFLAMCAKTKSAAFENRAAAQELRVVAGASPLMGTLRQTKKLDGPKK